MKYLITLVLGLIVWPAVSQVDLRLNLEEGKSYTQNTQSNASIVQNLMGQEIKIDVGLKGQMTFTVDKANQDNYEMTVRFDNLMMSMGSLQGKTEFDSENPKEGDAYSQILSNVIGKPFNITMSKTGEIVDIKNMDQVWESAFADQNISATEKAQILSQLNQTYGAKAMKGNIEMVTAIFPESKVNLGDTWTNSVRLASGMEGELKTEYTYEGTENGLNKISGKGAIETLDKDAYLNVNGLDLKFDMTGSMNSEIKVDQSSGWIVEATINQTIDGTASMKGNEQMPNGLTIPMKINTEMNVSN